MKPLGIISGTFFPQGKGIFADLKEETVDTVFGRALVFRSQEIAFIPRHGKDPNRHILPHLINHPANLKALKDLGAAEVIGIHSTGSLKRHLKPGMFVVPDDYIMMTAGPTAIREKPAHIAPVLSAELRGKWREAARRCGIDAVDGGIYWQTAGPRLETRAEIAMMSQFADLVGMTMAGEAIVAQELGLPFASLCSVDNFAHGLEDRELTMEKILGQTRKNAGIILRILTRYVEWNGQPADPT
jgi:5'-methylthioadenosine phosphorylase